MTRETLLTIKYKKAFPILFLLCSAVILYAALVVGFTTNTIIGLISLLLGILMLTRSVIVITPNTIQMKNLLGMTVKEYSYAPEQVSVRDNSVFVNDKKIFSAWWTDTNVRKLSAFFELGG
jgi:membrane-bound ClpP family serine protease